MPASGAAAMRGHRHLQDAYLDHDNVRNHYKLL